MIRGPDFEVYQDDGSYGDFLYGSSSPFELRWLEIDIACLISLRHSGDSNLYL